MIAVVSLNSAVDRTLRVEGLAPGHVTPAEFIAETPAGKGVNLARVLGALGVPVLLLGLVGRDRALAFEESFAGTSVQCRLVPLARRTRLNLTLLDANGAETHLRERGEAMPAGELEDFLERLPDAVRGCDWTIFSGSLPLGLAPERFSGLIAATRREGTRVGVDASDAALAAAVDAGVDLLKPNRDELAALVDRSLPDDAALRAAARGLRPAPPELLVSDGPQGAWLFAADQVWRARAVVAPPIVKTVGAGDALLAGYLAARLAGDAFPEALGRAVAVAGASLGCVSPGMIEPTQLASQVIETLCLQ